ncbi:C-type natriuretic peptide 1 [Pelodiscus sinensis]|uniref:C-type natriuretic peptide 1 n=1 Tax=Pelodiscus sinensis TaxID=13735 RepID=UPI003F6B7B2C
MNPKLIFSGGFLMLLLLSQDQARAKPISSLQSLSRLLEEEQEHPLASEEMDQEREDMIPAGAFDLQDSELQWARHSRDQPEGGPVSDSTFQRLFSDLLGSSRRYRGRSKKGLSRGCFGVKLDRIGSLSGLGC